MADTLISIAVADPVHVALTPSDVSKTVTTGSSYMVSFLPHQTFEVRVVDSLGFDSGWTEGLLTHTWVTSTPSLSINVMTQPIPITVKTVSATLLARYYAGEVVPPSGSETDTFFMDDFIGGVVDAENGNVLRAASKLWYMKAAEYARLIDRDDAGAVRKLTQRYKQAKDMAEEFEAAAKEYDTGQAGAVRVAGKVVALRGPMGVGWRVDGEYWYQGLDIVTNEFRLGGLPPQTRTAFGTAPGY